MKIMFVKPNVGAGRSADALEPAVFALLAGLTPPDVDLDLYDDRIESIPADATADLVAMTVDTFSAGRAYRLAADFRRRGLPVIMGGFHPTLCPDEVARHADAVAIGDAEDVWPQVVSDLRAGRLQTRYESGYGALSGLCPDRSIFKGKAYGPVAIVEHGRGCRYSCDFCSIHAVYGAVHRQRPVSEVLAEVAGLKRKLIVFADDNLLCDVRRARDLFAGLRSLRVRWAGQISLDIVRRPELMDLMAASGCISVTIGFESLATENLAQMGKSWNSRLGSYAEAVAVLRRRGIMVYGTFVCGYDHDTPATVQAALDFAVGSRLFLANFNPLMPLPGTPLLARLRASGRLLQDPWWLHPDYRWGDVVFRPACMSARQLAEACREARRRFNSLGCIARRALDLRANFGSPLRAMTYLMCNRATRRELARKQGQRLGWRDLRPAAEATS